MKQSVRLRPGRDRSVRNRHHWIFSGAIAQIPPHSPGEIMSVESADGELLGYAYFQPGNSLAGRMLSFGNEDPLTAVRRHLKAAITLRQKWFTTPETTAYRLVHSEGDYLPGLIVDQYHDVLVLQISTNGMERLKPFILKELELLLHPTAIYERSDLPARRADGLKDYQALLTGTLPTPLIIKENGLNFEIDIPHGQKTGWFLDQREMRRRVGELAKDKKVLNCFAYSGGFSVYARRGGATSTTSVDISADATLLAQKNFELNHLADQNNHFVTADVFEWIREQSTWPYDLVILDPPAFAKKKNDVIAAGRAYKDLNRITLLKMPPQSLLLTCSCSYHVEPDLFQTIVFQAAAEAKREVRILERHRLATDHPINIYHREGEYLKSLLLYVE